jgi:hypothetical protein
VRELIYVIASLLEDLASGGLFERLAGILTPARDGPAAGICNGRYVIAQLHQDLTRRVDQDDSDGDAGRLHSVIVQ